MMASQFKSGDPKYGLMYELYVIVAVVLVVRLFRGER